MKTIKTIPELLIQKKVFQFFYDEEQKQKKDYSFNNFKTYLDENNIPEFQKLLEDHENLQQKFLINLNDSKKDRSQFLEESY